jgi:prepilin-type processing-associated H-X9-DG protein
LGSYGANDWIYNAPKVVQSRPLAYYWRKITAIPRPIDTPAMGDCMWRGGGPGYQTSASAEPPRQIFFPYNGASYEMRHFAMFRHSKGVNLGMFDGSARFFRPRKLWELEWHSGYDVSRVSKQPPTYFEPWMR